MIKLTQADVQRFWSFVDRKGPADCWLWQGGGPRNPYGNFSIGPRGLAKTYLAHRVSYQLAYGPTHLHVCHSCDNPRCVNPQHLFAGTQRDNRQDCKRKNRTARGRQHGKVVLTEHEVKQIVGLDNRGHTSGEIARELRRKPTTVYNVIKGLSWSWLTGRQRKVLEMME